jgi:hypothetical protein
MRQLVYCVFISLIAIVGVACAGTASGQQTLVAYDNQLETRRAALAVTSTAEMERLVFTLDASHLMLTRVNDSQLGLISTLDARDIPVVMPPTRIPGPISNAPAGTTDTPRARINDNPRRQTRQAERNLSPAANNSQPTNVPVTPFAPSPTAQPGRPSPVPVTPATTPNGQLQEIVTSRAVDPDTDCAVDVANNFSPDADSIYVVARATGITSGTQISSDWARNGGELLATFTFTPDFDIDDACIWFFAEPTDFEFAPGSYSVTLRIDGLPAAEPARFIIQ